MVKTSPEFARALVAGNLIDIGERMDFILNRFNGDSKKSFLDLVQGLDRIYMVATFIALLELVKRRELSIRQAKLFGNIFIHRSIN